MNYDDSYGEIEILSAMRMGVEFSHPVKIRNFTVNLRPLSIAETLEVANLTKNQMQQLPEEQKHRLQEHTLLAMNTLEKASTPFGQGQVAKLPAKIMSLMTPDEVHHIHDEYVKICDKINPSFELMNSDHVFGLVKDLKKNFKGVPQLIELSSKELVSIVHFLLTREDSLSDK